MSYTEYVKRKLTRSPPSGFTDIPQLISPMFPHQDVLVKWALRRGKAAIFANTGLGKSRMQIAWADAVCRVTGGDVLILAPLAVAAQTVREGLAVGVQITHCRELGDVRSGINIINYDRLHKLDASRFVGVVLDESSIIKHNDTKTLARLIAAFEQTPYKLCATATPAPNDFTELGTHAEFLGICTHAEMLAEYFVHDAAKTQDWRLKGHAKKEFWRFVASWGAMLSTPAELGFDGSMYELPPLHVHEHTVQSCMDTANTQGFLFPVEAGSLSERRDARKASIDDRVAACADMVNSNNRQWLIWCDLNAEADALMAAMPGAIEIRGSDDPDDKERRLMDFADGKIRVLITKPKIAGWGLNFQSCHDMAFVGVTDSYEAYYQAIRRCWRFGQTHEVNAHIFASESEGSVIANLRRKEADSLTMARELARETNDAVRAEIFGSKRRTNPYTANQPVNLPDWLRSEAA